MVALFFRAAVPAITKAAPKPGRTTRRACVNIAILQDDCEVAVIGAGPYGLAAAAHLTAAKIDTRVFGRPMSFWREHMPKGMRLRSPWIATDIADPQKKFALDVYAGWHGIARQEQLPLEDFVRYGDWFQRQAVPGLDTRSVWRVDADDRGFRLTLDDGRTVRARRVVMAMGLAHQELRLPQFDGMAADLVSHSCDHARLDKWPGRRVAVVGRGQSACESAALLRAAGSEVDLICRGDVRWVGTAPGNAIPRHDWKWRLRELLQSPSAVGPFPWSWLNELPGIERRLPQSLRSRINTRSLRAASAWWVMPGLDGVRVVGGSAIRRASMAGQQVTIELDGGARSYDHVLLGTGYQIDVSKLGILAPELMSAVTRLNGSPVLGAGLESSVPGLHFVGASAVASYGPLMRFIAGSGFAARSVTRAALKGRRVRGIDLRDREIAPGPRIAQY
jgi:cation diffusion facilitator CzcD-associated flavoprotein CzcO